MTNAGAPASALALTVTNGNFANAAAGANTASAFVLTGAAAGTTTLNISGSSFANNGGGSGLDITAGTTGAPLNLNGQVDTSTFANSSNGVILQANGSSAVAFHTVNNTSFTRMSAQSILYQSNPTASGTVQGRITGNTIGNSATAGSACSTTNCGGIAVNHNDAGANTNTSALQVTISGNTIQQIQNGYGIDVFGSGAGSAHTLISGNLLRLPAGNNVFQLEAIDVNYATQTPTTVQVCTAVTGNTISSAGGTTTWGAGLSGTDMHLRQRNTVNVRLPGYGGAASDTNAVQVFVSGNNGGSSVTAEIDGTASGYLGGAACTTP